MKVVFDLVKTSLETLLLQGLPPLFPQQINDGPTIK
jgi:hypothetical protein